MSDDVLNAWLERERTLRATQAQHTTADPNAARLARETGGLAWMEAMMRGELPGPSIGHTMDFLLVEVGPGRAVFQGTPGDKYYNPMGGVHGGWYATLLDSALGCAVHTRMPAGRGYTTTQLNMNIVKAIGRQVQRVRAIGEVVHCGRQLATAQARLEGPDGTLYAHATTNCLVFELPAQSKP